MSTLKELGYKVVILGDVPTFESASNICSPRPVYLRQKGCGITTSELNRQIDIYNPFLQQLAYEQKITYLPTNNRLLCGEENCSMVRNGVLLYRDKHHLNAHGSRLIGGDFATRLLENSLVR